VKKSHQLLFQVGLNIHPTHHAGNLVKTAIRKSKITLDQRSNKNEIW